MPKATVEATTAKRPGVAIDPIFAAIENHKDLDKAWLDLERTDAAECDVDRANDAAEKAAWRMACTRPSTTAGAAALLEYITAGPVTGLFGVGETQWHEAAFRNVAKSLAAITQSAASARKET